MVYSVIPLRGFLGFCLRLALARLRRSPQDSSKRIAASGIFRDIVSVEIARKLLSRHARTLVVDVGANLGEFAKRLSGAQVLMLEPSIELRNGLRELAAQRGYEFVPAAAGKYSGKAQFTFLPRHSGGSHLKGLSRDVQGATEYEVDVVTIDALLERRTEHRVFIKIDVEGHELAVIQGCSKTIQTKRPIFCVEFSDYSRDAAELSEVLPGYRFYMPVVLGLDFESWSLKRTAKFVYAAVQPKCLIVECGGRETYAAAIFCVPEEETNRFRKAIDALQASGVNMLS